MLLLMHSFESGGAVDPPGDSTQGYSGLVWAFISLLLTVMTHGG